jgi:hypothetical protein
LLAVTQYRPDHVGRCRRRIAADVAAFSKAKANGSAETAFFNNMVLSLDHYFLHRVRKNEGKDGNPLNEVRVLCDSLTDNDGVLAADKTIRLKPEKSILGLKVGDEIKLTEADFRRLADAFLAEIESRY